MCGLPRAVDSDIHLTQVLLTPNPPNLRRMHMEGCLMRAFLILFCTTAIAASGQTFAVVASFDAPNAATPQLFSPRCQFQHPDPG
jgi:hypothetical protein